MDMVKETLLSKGSSIVGLAGKDVPLTASTWACILYGDGEGECMCLRYLNKLKQAKLNTIEETP